MANAPKGMNSAPALSARVSVEEDNSENYNTIEAVVTSVTTAATLIDIPENAKKVVLKNLSATTIWIGQSSSITAAGSTSFPLIQNDSLTLDIAPGSTEMWAIVNAGSVSLYVLGLYRE